MTEPTQGPDPWKSFRGVMAGTLILEAIVVLLALPVVGAVGGGLNPASTGYLVGVAVLLSPGLFGIGTEPLWAKMLFLGAALSYAFAATFARWFSGVSILVAAAGQLTGSTLLMAPLAAVAAVAAVVAG